MSEQKRYLERAAECLRLADLCTSRALAQQYEDIAHCYYQLAKVDAPQPGGDGKWNLELPNRILLAKESPHGDQ